MLDEATHAAQQQRIDLEVKGLYERAFRALVPMEANGNTPHSPNKSPSHSPQTKSKGRKEKK